MNLKTLTKHLLWKWRCKFDGRKCNSHQYWNNNKCRCECKKRHVCEKNYIWNSFICSCENGIYLANTMNYSAIRCDEIIESTTIPVNFNEKKATCRMQNSHILLAFLLITVTLLIGVIIDYYLIKY